MDSNFFADIRLGAVLALVLRLLAKHTSGHGVPHSVCQPRAQRRYHTAGAAFSSEGTLAAR